MSTGTKQVKRHRSHASFVALLLAFAALGVWASYALAGTKGGGGQVIVNIEKHNDDCGDTQGKKVIGTSTLSRSGNTLSALTKLHGADPGNYSLYIYDALSTNCSIAYFLGKFKVDSSGSGGRSSSTDVSGTSGQFVVCAYNDDTGTYNCALLAKLGNNQLTTT